jgi:hypothetical protein
MDRSAAWKGILVGLPLVLPVPGSTSRDRGFCRAWLGLPPAGREEVLLRAEAAEARSGWAPACRRGLRPGLRHRLDAECRNWSRLMDLEVRAVVDAVLEPCRETDAS